MRDALEALIQESRSIVRLSHDWDGEGSPAYSLATWQRAVNLLRRDAERWRVDTGCEVPLPRILPGPDGDIDIHWVQPDYRLLLSVGDAPELVVFHYSRGSTVSIRGSFDPDTASVIQWLRA